MTDQITGGHFLVSRLIFNSAIWGKPPQYLKLWFWIIGKANFQDGYKYKGHVLKRGELITTYGEIARALSFTFNRKIIEPSLKEIRIALLWLQSEDMISVKPLIDGTMPNKGRHHDLTRAYLGLRIYIINYDTYQDVESYKGTDKGRHLAEQGHIEKENEKEVLKNPCDFSSKISELGKRYTDQETINQAFQAFASTRKTNRIADSVKLKILQSWEKYPVSQVMAGIRTFLDKDYHQQGKKEAYLLGIIRNHKPVESITGGQVMKATGSCLDDYYRSQGIRII